MSRRIDIELTSNRDDGSWTWRAAGAREPRGSLSGDLLPAGASVGDVLKVEVEGYLDGVEVVAVVPARAPRREPERLELLTPTRRDEELVTTKLAGRRPGGRGRDRGERGDRAERGEGRGRGERRDGRDRDRRDGRDRDRRDRRPERSDRDRPGRGPRPERPTPAPAEAKPKPKRLRPGRVHRAALLDAVAAEQRPILEQLLQGGIPAVRQAIDKQNESLKVEGKTEVNKDALLKVAEDLRPRAAAALWRDRAEAAVANVDELDLRDLRSVVNAASDAGRDEDARALATQLREALVNRVEKEQSAWLAELADNLREGRTVRALRLSSRPPKAGAIIPADLSNQLVEQAGAALTEDTGQDRWATVLDALAYSPIRRRVIPTSLPVKLSPQLREVVARLGSRLPEIAHIFAIEPDEAAGRTARPPRRRGAGAGGSGSSRSGDRPPRKGKGKGGGGGGRGERGARNERAADAKPTPKGGSSDASTSGPSATEVPDPEANTTLADIAEKPDTVGSGADTASEAQPGAEQAPEPEASASEPDAATESSSEAGAEALTGDESASSQPPEATSEAPEQAEVKESEAPSGTTVIEVGTPPEGEGEGSTDQPAPNPA